MFRHARRVLSIAALIALAPVGSQAADAHKHATGAASPSEPLFEGLGPVHHKVTTKDPLAQKYFDQGLRLSYAFNHDEAGRSFQEAARLDPQCAMAWWGAALVLGPNINLPMSADAEKSAYELVQKAVAASSGAGEDEKAMIQALAKRYDATPGANRAAHDSSYADAMRGVMKRFPEDADAAVLTAEALMDLRPWDLWKMDGSPQPGTMEIVSILEGVLKKNKDHTGAIHLYIHAVEASPEPARAEAWGDRLAQLAPGAGHLVHMPTHIHLRVGRYDDAAEINARAIAVDRRYIRERNEHGLYTIMYYPHNIHMRWSALCSEGRRSDALQAARELEQAVPDSVIREMPMAEFFRPARYLTLTRFGLWDEALKEPPPPAGMPFMRGAWHYARGLALASTGKTAEATAERDSVLAVAASLGPDMYYSLNPAAPIFRFAAEHLSGEIASKSGNMDEAIRLLEHASRLQDSLRYDEPPPWPQTARQSLGVVLLAAGRAPEAEAVYREDLTRFPENGWALYGLTQALRAQKKTKEADDVEKRFRKAWERSDTQLQASRF